MNKQTLVVTVDGPSGVGKGTLCSALAQRFGFSILDSGAIYRLLGLAAIGEAIPFDAEASLLDLAQRIDIRFDFDNQSMQSIAYLNGRNVATEIRTQDAADAASKIAVIPRLREQILTLQRDFAQGTGLVADGRDMGTVVFPDAKVKIFLDASAEVRAARRCSQLQEAGQSATFDVIYQDVIDRDCRDRNRKVAPLIAASDAITVDTSDLKAEQVFETVMKIVQARLG